MPAILSDTLHDDKPSIDKILYKWNYQKRMLWPYCLTLSAKQWVSRFEKRELNKLEYNEHLKNALRGIIADNGAGIIFNMLNLINGTGSPKHMYNDWTGIKLIDGEPNESEPGFQGTLHDSFFETYWEWKKIRSDKKWKLDTYEEGKQ